MVITGVTWLFLPSVCIVFGVLHFIGLSILLAPLFVRLDASRLIVASVACFIAGYAVTLVNGPWHLLWLGIRPASFASLDYVPLFPWFGIVLAGMACGHTFYPDGRRGFRLGDPGPAVLRPFSFLGRHSLLIYFLHQPVILFMIAVLAPGAVRFFG